MELANNIMAATRDPRHCSQRRRDRIPLQVRGMKRRAAALPQRRGDKRREEARDLLKARVQVNESHKLGRLAARGARQGQVRALKPMKRVTIQSSDDGDWHRADDAAEWLSRVAKYFAEKRGVGNVDERMKVLEMCLTEGEAGDEQLRFTAEEMMETWSRLKRRGTVRSY